MTDTSFSVTAVTGHDYLAVSPPHGNSTAHSHNDSTAVDGTAEDDGQINCMCGINEDDGMTVACDLCNTWQHQSCYYPDYEDRKLPEALQHYCIDCRPRDNVDRTRARRRQMQRQDQQASLSNGARRQPQKGRQKKNKDAAFTNGWPLDKSRHDRNSASPRDQAPPAKRPKTSHRTSDSTTNASLKGHNRKRNVSSAVHRRSLSRSPETALDLYTPEFMRCYLDDPWTITETNLHNSMTVTNALTEWLRVNDDDFHDMHGYEKPEVLLRWDQDLDEIPGKAQIELQQIHDNRIKDDEGNHPTWKMVTVKEPVANGGYIGELKGHVGFKEDYQQDPANRWSLLRHPEPFVFFHPRLPIYVDARNEGTELRYVRRSCAPNARLQILVTSGTEYHFCFMATQQIDPGMEVAVSWDTADGMPELLQRSQNGHALSHKDMDHLSSWVSTVLANSGPCACHQPANECLMCRFDRRRMRTDDEDDTHSVKMPKAKKKRPTNISPLNTHVNSRSGSEARRVDPDEDPTDSRSTSGSGRGGSASRDITPNTHYSHSGSLSTVPELSERERKKLLKEEEMFRRQEEEAQTSKQSKKKRTSGGSTLSTPSATTSKHTFGPSGNSRYADAGTTRQSGLPTPAGRSGRRPKNVAPADPEHRTVITKVVKRPKPDYVDAEVQCDLDGEEALQSRTPALPHRPFLSTTQRLLQRCANNNARRKGQAVSPPAAKSPLSQDSERMDVDVITASAPSPTSTAAPSLATMPLQSADSITEAEDGDVEMPDASSHEPLATAKDSGTPDPNHLSSAANPSHLPMNPPAPPWSSQASHSAQIPSAAPPPSTRHHAPMHLAMPPPISISPTLSSAASAVSSTTPTGSTNPPVSPNIPAALVQSPATLTPGPGAAFFSPTTPAGSIAPASAAAAAAAVSASSARKKLSLSDYTRRNKAKDSTLPDSLNRTESENNSPPSNPSTLVHSSSDAALVTKDEAEGEEDVKMEESSSTAAAAAAAEMAASGNGAVRV